MTIDHIFTDKIQTMSAYHVQNTVGMIKLDAMESPYTLPDEMRHALGTALSLTNLNRYPNATSVSLVSKIKSTFHLPDGCKVLLGNGSDELIQIILMATCRPNSAVVSPAPSFVVYQQAAELLGMKYIGVDVNEDFSINESAFLATIQKEKPAVIFLAYPNNPTGTVCDKVFIEQVIKSSEGLVVLDEAYTAYTDESVLDFVVQYENVVVIRTLSKIGLAGIRLGYMVGNPHVVEQFNKARMPYNINVLSNATARFMLDQMHYLNAQVKKILVEKDALYQWLSQWDKITVFPSQTNFLLVRFNDANDVHGRLRSDYKIAVKNLHGSHPLLDNILRITIGSPKENEKLRQAIEAIISN